MARRAEALTAGEIRDLLAVRHSKDLFVPECKDGPTHYTEHRRLDAWAMARSWAHPCFTGYEIKVSRSDWLKDQKIVDYLPLCNRLWIVAPVGVLHLEELPETVGWLAPASTGSMLMTKRKAIYREIAPPIDLITYVLMCRTRIDGERRHAQTREERAAEWKERLEDKDAFRRLGYLVSMKLRKDTATRVEEAERRADAAESRAEKLQEAAQVLKELGVDLPRIWGLKSQIQDAMDPLRSARIALESAVKALAKVEGDHAAPDVKASTNGS